MFFKIKNKSEPVPEPAPVSIPQKTFYEFIAKSQDEKTEKALIKYQKFWTDPEDKYDGMTLKDFKAEGCPGDKVYEYPTLDVDVKLEAFLGEDGSIEIRVFILDCDSEIYVGTAAKTKAKKILRILQEENPSFTGVLYGGKYWKMEDSGYVNNDWADPLTVRVYMAY